MTAAPAGRSPGPNRNFPRSHRLKRRAVIRTLFRRGGAGTVRRKVGDILVVGRLVPRPQLPEGAPVQLGVAAGRGLRGVRRNQTRRRLREAFREYALPELRTQLPRIPDGLVIALMLIDARKDAAEIDVPAAGGALSAEIAPLVDQLLRLGLPTLQTDTP